MPAKEVFPAEDRGNPRSGGCNPGGEPGKAACLGRPIPAATWVALCLGLSFLDLGAFALTGRAQEKPAGNPAANAAPVTPAHQQPVVNGYHVQPRPSDFNGAEFAPAQSDEVDQLYRQIQQMRAGEAAEAKKILEGH
jgi:hypothetical protein